MEKYNITSSEQRYFHFYLIHSEKCKEIDLDLFPYSRFILRCIHSRPSFDLDHHSCFWKQYNNSQEHCTARDESKTYCKILKKVSKRNIYIVKMVLQKLRSICKYNEEENQYIRSLSFIWTALSEIIKGNYSDLDYMYWCFDFIQVLLQDSRNRSTYANGSRMFLSIIKYSGFCASEFQMCEIKDSFFQFEHTMQRKEEIIAARCAGVHYMIFSTQIFFKDPDSWPLPAALASFLTGQDEVRVEFRRLGFGKIVSKIMQKSHDNLLVYENCLKVLYTATDGKSENVVTLFKNNDVLIDEIQYALRYLASTPMICEKVINIMTKLFKADNESAKWMINDEIQTQVTILSAHHRNVVTIQSACTQLEMIMKYSRHTSSGGNCEASRQLSCSRNPNSEETRNPRKVRHRAERERTRAPPKMRQRPIRDETVLQEISQGMENVGKGANDESSTQDVILHRTTRLWPDYRKSNGQSGEDN